MLSSFNTLCPCAVSKEGRSIFHTLGSKRICHTSEGGASRVARVALESTSKTRTKLSSEDEAAMEPSGWAATEATPRQWPVLVRSRTSSSDLQSLTVSSREPVRRSGGRLAVAGAHVTAHTESSCAFSTDLSPPSFIVLRSAQCSMLIPLLRLLLHQFSTLVDLCGPFSFRPINSFRPIHPKLSCHYNALEKKEWMLKLVYTRVLVKFLLKLRKYLLQSLRWKTLIMFVPLYLNANKS